MTISFRDASSESYLQGLRAAAGFMARAASHVGGEPERLADLVETSLYPDMRPFRFQIVSIIHHSVGALDGVRSGMFRPPSDTTPYDFAGLQKRVADTIKQLETAPAGLDPDDRSEVVFEAGDIKLRFTAEKFLLSFSLPNFYFHATTAYDILRMKGVPLAKRDYLGTPRFEGRP